MMNKKLTFLTLILTTAIGLQVIGAVNPLTANAAVATIAKDTTHAQAVYKAALPLLQAPDKLPQAISYVNNNIYAVSAYQATLMTLKLENAHKAVLNSWENRFESNDIQRKLTAIYKPGLNMAKLAKEAEDTSLRTLLESAGESGYKLESAEGTFFPVIDYGAYRKYKMYVTNDIRDYISIMATESDLVSSKDNSLVIAWTEVASRALSQEKFSRTYPRSNRIGAVKQLYNRYETYTFYGLSNTPLFHYDNLEMDLEAQKAYSGILTKYEDRTPYLDKLYGFMKLMKEHEYKLVDQVEQYRSKKASADI